MIHLLLLLERHPLLRRRAIAALAAEPQVFQRFLAINDGQATLRSLGSGTRPASPGGWRRRGRGREAAATRRSTS